MTCHVMTRRRFSELKIKKKTQWRQDFHMTSVDLLILRVDEDYQSLSRIHDGIRVEKNEHQRLCCGEQSKKTRWEDSICVALGRLWCMSDIWVDVQSLHERFATISANFLTERLGISKPNIGSRALARRRSKMLRGIMQSLPVSGTPKATKAIQREHKKMMELQVSTLTQIDRFIFRCRGLHGSPIFDESTLEV